MLHFDQSRWDRAKTLPSILHEPYLLTTNVIPSAGTSREHLIAPPHSHPDAMLAWCQRGGVWVHLRGSLCRLTPLRALWVPAGVAHTAHQERGSIACFTYVARRGLRRPVEAVEGVSLPRAAREMLLHLDLDHVDDDLRVSMQGPLVQLLQAPAAGSAPAGPGQLPLPVDERVRRLAFSVLESPGARDGLVELARAHQLHERTVARVFRREVGTSFSQWRTLVRMLHAEDLLAGGATVATAAARCGYDSPSAFAAAFKAHAGLTPSDHAARARAQAG